jgi:hypothetical protein
MPAEGAAREAFPGGGFARVFPNYSINQISFILIKNNSMPAPKKAFQTKNVFYVGNIFC